jgi:mannose-1-phosphate guanylyltransferase
LQALILAGGEGTRLRPLTSTVPKPVVQLVNRPFISYMLEWLRRHDVDDVILSCGFMAEGVRSVLGDGSRYGIRLRYLEEPRPLGTGGALKFAQELLDERFFMLNGDVLTDIDLTDQLAQHERTGARATLALIEVDDPSAYGLVRLEPDRAVKEFVEKPELDQIDTNLINAGAYILHRDVLDIMPPAGTNVSIEREVFPRLVGAGLCALPLSGYWMDIGVPERYLQATWDILEGRVETAVRPTAPGLFVGAGCTVSESARIGPRAVVSRGCTVAGEATIAGSVLFEGCTVGEGAVISDSIIAADTVVEPGARLKGMTVAAHERVGAE